LSHFQKGEGKGKRVTESVTDFLTSERAAVTVAMIAETKEETENRN
jgi:hypothetical protein